MKRLIFASSNREVPYQLVSMAAIIRDFDEPEYKSAEHQALTDIADFLYNAGLGSEYLKDESKKLYDRYGKEYWDKVLEDMSAIDSQLDGHGDFNYHLRKEEELLADYNDRIGITASTKVTASIDSEIINRAKEVVDYLNSHNRNLNRRQEQLIDELADAINSKSISGIRSAIGGLKYNSKNLNNKQYALVIDLYDDFNFANGKFNGMGRVESSTKVTASAWVAPNGKKYGKQTRRFPGKYLFTRRELKSMVDEGVANKLDVDINSLNYDIIGISWNDTNGYRSGILIKDRDSGELFVGNTADANVARLS